MKPLGPSLSKARRGKSKVVRPFDRSTGSPRAANNSGRQAVVTHAEFSRVNSGPTFTVEDARDYDGEQIEATLRRVIREELHTT